MKTKTLMWLGVAFYAVDGIAIILKMGGFINISWWWIMPLALAFSLVLIGFIKASFNPPYFHNEQGTFHHLDMAIDPKIHNYERTPGVLKFDFIEGWFICYFDGFEWKISSKENIIKYNG